MVKWQELLTAAFLQSDFLLFMPASHGSPLEAALSYYSSIVTLNAEGDSMVTEETLEGLGTTGFLLQALFGSILRLAQPPPPDQSPILKPPGTSCPIPGTGPRAHQTQPPPPQPTTPDLQPPLAPSENETAASDGMAAAYASFPQTAAGSVSSIAVTATGAIQQATGHKSKVAQVGTSSCTYEQNGGPVKFLDIHDHDPQLQLREVDEECEDQGFKTRLTQYLPEPGYFVAGALSGGISRTATAPFDRLKVALLVNTRVKPDAAIDAAKRGHGVTALRNAGKPISEAARELYKTGGIRTFFAGELLSTSQHTCNAIPLPWSFDLTVHRKRTQCHQDHA